MPGASHYSTLCQEVDEQLMGQALHLPSDLSPRLLQLLCMHIHPSPRRSSYLAPEIASIHKKRTFRKRTVPFRVDRTGLVYTLFA